MAIYQVFVKLLDGKTQCLQISSPTVAGETLKRVLFLKTKIPLGFQRLVSGSREISDETLISASADGIFPSCNLLLRLRGGKGGFGSLLRGAATKAGQKKTNNFDACRDMSGRRLRHVNAEKKLEEWKAEADERKLEKIAEQFLKKKAKEIKKKSSGAVEKYLEKYRQDSAKCMEEVEESVRQSFSLYKESKRKILPAPGPASKRLKIWSGKKKVNESESEDDEDNEGDGDHEDEKSVVLDEGNCPVQIKDVEGSSSSVSGVQSDGESSGGGSGKSNLEEEDGSSDQCCFKMGDGSGNRDSHTDSDAIVEPAVGTHEETAVENTVVYSLEKLLDSSEVELAIEKHVEPELIKKETVSQSISISTMEEPLNFDKFSSAAEMEVIGMERLKAELQAHGLKCGGTLQERAARLFLLKTTPLEKLPKKVLAKPTGGGK